MLTLRRAFRRDHRCPARYERGGGCVAHGRQPGVPCRPPKNTATAVTSSARRRSRAQPSCSPLTVQRNGAGTTDPTSGTITFYDGATVLGTGSVGADPPGHVLDGGALRWVRTRSPAAFDGDANFAPSVSPVFTQVVSHNPTTTAVDPTSTLRNSVSRSRPRPACFLVRYPDSAGHFADNGVAITGCETQPLVAGNATCTTYRAHGRQPRDHRRLQRRADVLAEYFRRVDESVDALATATALSADVNPSTFGDVVTFTAVVSAPDGPALDERHRLPSTTGWTSSAAASRRNPRSRHALDRFVEAGSHDITAVYGGIATTRPAPRPSPRRSSPRRTPRPRWPSPSTRRSSATR